MFGEMKKNTHTNERPRERETTNQPVVCCTVYDIRKSKSVRRPIMDHSDKDELIIALDFVKKRKKKYVRYMCFQLRFRLNRQIQGGESDEYSMCACITGK